MNIKIPAIITAVIAVVGASGDQRIIAGIIGAAFVVCTFIRLVPEMRILLLSATGFPLVFTSGYPAVAGVVIFCLLWTLFAASGAKISPRIILAAGAAGLAGAVYALQLSLMVPILVTAIFIIIIIYILFVREYRLKKEVKGANK
jgi:hypothetical protein